MKDLGFEEWPLSTPSRCLWANANELIVVENFFEELKAKVGN